MGFENHSSTISLNVAPRYAEHHFSTLLQLNVILIIDSFTQGNAETPTMLHAAANPCLIMRVIAIQPSYTNASHSDAPASHRQATMPAAFGGPAASLTLVCEKMCKCSSCKPARNQYFQCSMTPFMPTLAIATLKMRIQLHQHVIMPLVQSGTRAGTSFPPTAFEWGGSGGSEKAGGVQT